MIRVYVMRESDTGALRYVGVTRKELAERRRGHLKAARQRRRTRGDKWIAGVLARGADVLIEQIDETTLEDWQLVEQAWICHYRYIEKLDLVNGTDGGTGNINPSAELRARYAELMSERFKGKPSHLRGTTLSIEHRTAIGNAVRGRKDSDEIKERKRLAALAREARKRVAGPTAQQAGGHARWHVARGVVKPGCPLC